METLGLRRGRGPRERGGRAEKDRNMEKGEKGVTMDERAVQLRKCVLAWVVGVDPSPAAHLATPPLGNQPLAASPPR